MAFNFGGGGGAGNNAPQFNFNAGNAAGGFHFGRGAPAAAAAAPIGGGNHDGPNQPAQAPASVFSMKSSAADMLTAFYEQFGPHATAGAVAGASPGGRKSDAPVLRPVYRRLDPATLNDKSNADDDDASSAPREQRYTSQWDAAFALLSLIEDHTTVTDADSDEGQLLPMPPPLAFTLAYMLSFRCVQTGRCDIEHCVLLGRGRGNAFCRRMPMCTPAVQSSRLVGRMLMAQAAAVAYPLRGDATTQRYLQDADSFVINDPYLIQYIANCDALSNARTIRYTCLVPDVDLQGITEHATNLEALIFGGNCVGHPEVLKDLVSKVHTLTRLELCTGPMLVWALQSVLEAKPPALETLAISAHKSRTDNSDKAEFEAQAVTGVLTNALEQPKLRRLVFHLGIGFQVDHVNTERFTVEFLERMAKAPLFNTIEELRIQTPMDCLEHEAAAVFAGNERLHELRLTNIAATALEQHRRTQTEQQQQQQQQADGDDAAAEAPAAPKEEVPRAIAPPSCTAFTCNAAYPSDDDEGENDVLTILGLTRVRRGPLNSPDIPPQLAALPRFTNLRQLTLRCADMYTTEADVAPLAKLKWLERAVLIGDLLNALEPLSKLERLVDLTLDYSLPSFQPEPPAAAAGGAQPGAFAPVGFGRPPQPHLPRRPANVPAEAERYSWLTLQPLTRMTWLKALSIRGLGDLDILKPSLFDGSFSLRRLEIVNSAHVTDAEILAAVQSNRELEVVGLSDLEKLSNRGIASLEDLLWLRDLSVLRCPHVTERGLLRVAERCRALQTTALEAGMNDTYVADSSLNKLAARAGMHLKFPDITIGYEINSMDSTLL